MKFRCPVNFLFVADVLSVRHLFPGDAASLPSYCRLPKFRYTFRCVEPTMRHVLLTGMIMLSGIATSSGGEVEFVEDFSLAPDREVALKQLIPGTEDYYYWNCLHLLNTEQCDKVDEVLKPWVQRHGETARVWEIRTRRALLSYDRNPQQSLEYLRNRFGIHYPHQKEELNADPDLPTASMPALISREQYKQRALQRHGNSLNGFEDSASRVADQGPTEPRPASAATGASGAPRLSATGTAGRRRSESPQDPKGLARMAFTARCSRRNSTSC